MNADTMKVHPDTQPGMVALTVANMEGSLGFYRQVLAMELQAREDNLARLGPKGGEPLVELLHDPSAQPPQTPSTGLYHMALRLPARRDLAAMLEHMLQLAWPLQGAADHLVSEALYLADPEGNGIELYRDRPRQEWPYRDGELQMATNPLDVNGLLGELRREDNPAVAGMANQAVLGHVHLKVADIAAAERFYTGALGMELVTRYAGAASFVSAGGYHHHIGFNTWNSAGAPPPAPGSTGLRYFSLRIPDQAALDNLIARLSQLQVGMEETSQGILVRDPSQNGILLTSADGAF
jgi:catechol 2,3-dioxygenase